jgi:pimeloyl-ACP methyl ester carboxylesterase
VPDIVWPFAETPVPHGFSGRVPVVFLHPFPGADGIGRPLLRRAAEADVLFRCARGDAQDLNDAAHRVEDRTDLGVLLFCL